MTSTSTHANRLSASAFALLAAMLAAVALAAVLKPEKSGVAAQVDLESLIPAQFGQWREVKTALIQMDLTPRRDDGQLQQGVPELYDQTLMRSYTGPDGAVVMLALAYGSRQRQELKIHRPELCYVAQGFQVGGREVLANRGLTDRAVKITRMVAQNDRRVEPVTYWIRIGDEISTSALQSRLTILKEGLSGRIPDGILVRVSQVVPRGVTTEASYAVQEQFLRDLLGALDSGGRQLLVGRGSEVRS